MNKTGTIKSASGYITLISSSTKNINRIPYPLISMAGLKAARARGRKGGRPKVNQQKLNQAIAMYHSQRMTVKEIEEATGISAGTLYRELKKEQN